MKIEYYDVDVQKSIKKFFDALQKLNDSLEAKTLKMQKDIDQIRSIHHTKQKHIASHLQDIQNYIAQLKNALPK